MSALFDAYNLSVGSISQFYQRLNRPITYPDGMTTSLGIVYWGRDEHLLEIQKAISKFIENAILRFEDVALAAKTPARATKFCERTGIPQNIIRVLKHDIDLWLPVPVPLEQLNLMQIDPANIIAFCRVGLANQLDVISAGQTPIQRAELSRRTGLDQAVVDEFVRLCDFYRTGKNLDHIRSRIYYTMGLDTWQKWSEQTSEGVIAMFSEYIRDHPGETDRLVPWPKEVRNGIEWAKRHLEIFTVEW